MDSWLQVLHLTLLHCTLCPNIHFFTKNIPEMSAEVGPCVVVFSPFSLSSETGRLCLFFRPEWWGFSWIICFFLNFRHFWNIKFCKYTNLYTLKAFSQGFLNISLLPEAYKFLETQVDSSFFFLQFSPLIAGIEVCGPLTT